MQNKPPSPPYPVSLFPSSTEPQTYHPSLPKTQYSAIESTPVFTSLPHLHPTSSTVGQKRSSDVLGRLIGFSKGTVRRKPALTPRTRDGASANSKEKEMADSGSEDGRERRQQNATPNINVDKVTTAADLGPASSSSTVNPDPTTNHLASKFSSDSSTRSPPSLAPKLWRYHQRNIPRSRSLPSPRRPSRTLTLKNNLKTIRNRILSEKHTIPSQNTPKSLPSTSSNLFSDPLIAPRAPCPTRLESQTEQEPEKEEFMIMVRFPSAAHWPGDPFASFGQGDFQPALIPVTPDIKITGMTILLALIQEVVDDRMFGVHLPQIPPNIPLPHPHRVNSDARRADLISKTGEERQRELEGRWKVRFAFGDNYAGSWRGKVEVSDDEMLRRVWRYVEMGKWGRGDWIDVELKGEEDSTKWISEITMRTSSGGKMGKRRSSAMEGKGKAPSRLGLVDEGEERGDVYLNERFEGRSQKEEEKQREEEEKIREQQYRLDVFEGRIVDAAAAEERANFDYDEFHREQKRRFISGWKDIAGGRMPW